MSVENLQDTLKTVQSWAKHDVKRGYASRVHMTLSNIHWDADPGTLDESFYTLAAFEAYSIAYEAAEREQYEMGA